MYQALGGCYSTPLEATTALAASYVGQVHQIGGTAHYVISTNPGEYGIVVTYQPANSGSNFTQWQSVNPPECQLMTGADGLELGWLIAGAWLLTYSISFLARYLWREMHPSEQYHGDA